MPISGGTHRAGTAHDITALPPYERARRGIAYVPQGREIFPLLTVKENLETGFAPLPRARARRFPTTSSTLFPGAEGHAAAGAAATSPAASSSSSPSAARW